MNRQNVAAGLALLALATASFALKVSWDARRGAVEIPLVIGAAPTLPPAYLLPCDGKEPVGSLKDLMGKRINGAVTRISFALHHDTRELPERMDDIANTAAILLGCVRAASSYTPEIGLDKLSDYYHSLDEMQDHALAVQVSALESDEVSARHWFTHLRHDCASCHTRFRPTGEDLAER